MSISNWETLHEEQPSPSAIQQTKLKCSKKGNFLIEPTYFWGTQCKVELGCFCFSSSPDECPNDPPGMLSPKLKPSAVPSQYEPGTNGLTSLVQVPSKLTHIPCSYWWRHLTDCKQNICRARHFDWFCQQRKFRLCFRDMSEGQVLMAQDSLWYPLLLLPFLVTQAPG